jgi:hypothetical protein
MTALEAEAGCGASDSGARSIREILSALISPRPRVWPTTLLACRGLSRLSGYLIRLRTAPSVPLYRRVLRMTHKCADAENLLQAAMRSAGELSDGGRTCPNHSAWSCSAPPWKISRLRAPKSSASRTEP